LLLAVCLVLFIESRVEAFVPQLKIFARERLEEALGGKFRLSVGNIDGGIIHPLVFSDIRIRGGIFAACGELRQNQLQDMGCPF